MTTQTLSRVREETPDFDEFDTDGVMEPLVSWQMIRFIFGIPSILAVIAMLVLIASRSSSTTLLQRYHQKSHSLAAVQRWKELEIVDRRLLSINPHDQRAKYQYALCLERQGEHQRATQIMRRLAPHDRAGFGPAHAFLGQDLLQAKRTLTHEDVVALRRHLEAALSGQEPQLETRVPLANLLMKTGQWKDALPHLLVLKDSRPEFQLPLVKAYLQLSDESKAKATGRSAMEYYARELQQNLKNHSARKAVISLHSLFDQYDTAIQVAKDGIAADPDGPFSAIVGDLYLKQAAQTSMTKYLKKLALLELALHYAPRNQEALILLTKMAFTDSEGTEQANERLAREVAEGRMPATGHLILGTNAAMKGKFDQAIVHLEQAYDRNPQSAVVANNLAFSLLRADPPQLERALQLADSSIKAFKRPEFYETRGQILWKLGRHREAITDLERALEHLPGEPQIHVVLAEIYEQLGDNKLADIHGQLAQTSVEMRSPKDR